MNKEELKKRYNKLEGIYPAVVLGIAIALYTPLVITGLSMGIPVIQYIPWIGLIFTPTMILVLLFYSKARKFVRNYRRDFLELDLEACIEEKAKITKEIEELTGSQVIHRELDELEFGTVEGLAGILHEAGREAVEKRKVVAKDTKITKFLEWDEIDEDARDGRRIQARYLLSRFNIAKK